MSTIPKDIIKRDIDIKLAEYVEIYTIARTVSILYMIELPDYLPRDIK